MSPLHVPPRGQQRTHGRTLNTLFIRLPARHSLAPAADWEALELLYSLQDAQGRSVQQGRAAAAALQRLATSADRTVLMVPACDTTVLHLALPPLAPARLKTALPNLAEPYLLEDPANVMIAAGADEGGSRTLAVLDKGWLAHLQQQFARLGFRAYALQPEAVCLHAKAGTGLAQILPEGTGYAVALRLGDTAAGMRCEADAATALQCLLALNSSAPLAVYAAASEVVALQTALAALPAESTDRITLHPADGTQWRAAGVDFIARAAAADPDQGGRWRAPLAVLLILLAVNTVALNMDAWRMRQIGTTLQTGMVDTFRQTFPDETVVIDPLAQMKQKLDAERVRAGLGQAGGLSSLLALLARGQKLPVPAAVDYTPGRLDIHFSQPAAEGTLQSVRDAAAAQGIRLVIPAPDHWILEKP